jgi:putative PEP-CTERM system TPR-repeat lipoprotein
MPKIFPRGFFRPAVTRRFRLEPGRMGIAAWLTVAVLALTLPSAQADDARSYLQSAHELEKKNNFRAAEIQLRNAAQAAPGDAAIRVELAQIYLKLGNPNAAQAELFDARFRGAREEMLAPLMAQALLEMGDFANLLKNVPEGHRPAKVESMVRTYRGLAAFALGETDRARASLADAERLDPKSTLPLGGETRMLIERGQLDAAWQKANQVLKLDPKNADAIDAKGLILAARGDIGGAMQQFAAAIAIDPSNRALLDRANLEIVHRNLDAAEKDLRAVFKSRPDSMIAVYLQTTIDAEKGKLKEADALLARLRPAMSGFPPAYLIAAQVKLKLNQLDAAQDFAQKFIAKRSDNSRAYVILGSIALKRGDSEGAIAAFEKAVQLAPNDVNTMGALGQAFVAHGDLDKARAIFNQAVLKAPGNAPLATERALTDFATGDRAASVAALSEIFKGGKGSLLAGPPLVIEALQVGQVDVAEAAARALVARDPGNASYQELLAVVRIEQHDFAGAESLLRDLLGKQPNLSSARRDLAGVYFATNRATQAKALYQERLRANPKDVDSLESLADIAFREKDDNTAINLLTQAQAALPSNPKPSLQILAILEARKKWPDAIRRARALQPQFAVQPAVRDALAHLYWESGDHAAAAAAYKSAIAKFPKYAPMFAHYAAILATEKDYATAATMASRAVQIEPRNIDLKRALVTLTYLAKGTDAALAASQSVSRDDKTGNAAVLMTAGVLDSNNNRVGAIALLEKRQAQNPSAAVVVGLASLYQRDHRLDKALTVLESWAATHPADTDVRFALGQIESAEGKFDQALAQYEWLAAHKPDNPVILNNLAWLYDWKHDSRARATAERAIRLAPASGTVADTLGWILVKQGDTAGATKYLAQASATQRGNGTIQYHYAVALSKAGKSDQARDILQRLLKQNVSADTRSAAESLLAKIGRGG